jgi:6-phosphogluconolactonase
MDTKQFGQATVHIGKDNEEMAAAAAAEFARLAKEAVSERKQFTVALSGGSSPPMVYKYLLKDETIPWDRTRFFIGDERCVPDDSPENNFGVARRQLLDHVQACDEDLFPVVEPDKNPAWAARQYEEKLRAFFGIKVGEIPVFDLIWLGMGPDGHCASLFPGTNAREVFFVSHGADKAPVLAEALTSDVIKYPVQKVKPTHGKLVWFIDPEAAKDLLASPQAR